MKGESRRGKMKVKEKKRKQRNILAVCRSLQFTSLSLSLSFMGRSWHLQEGSFKRESSFMFKVPTNPIFFPFSFPQKKERKKVIYIIAKTHPSSSFLEFNNNKTKKLNYRLLRLLDFIDVFY